MVNSDGSIGKQLKNSVFPGKQCRCKPVGSLDAMTKKTETLERFPATRMRRTRAQDWSRRLVREHQLSPDNLIWPLFVREGGGSPEEIESLPGVARLSIDQLVEEARRAVDLGLPAIAIFPRIEPARKSEDGNHAGDSDNLFCQAIQAVKESVPGIGIVSDVALDPFTTHGHDGVIRDGVIDNDLTVEVLVRQALVQAKAGADIIAPSDMMDGRIGIIREALDTEGFKDVMIMAYAAKYASAFYGPFRDAVGAGQAANSVGKDTYQMDSANSDEAMREIALDIGEGADLVIVKPGMPYLDIIRRASTEFGVPVVAYQVSGEYAMIEAAAERGFLDRERIIMESLISFHRAGARAVLSYHAAEAAEVLSR